MVSVATLHEKQQSTNVQSKSARYCSNSKMSVTTFAKFPAQNLMETQIPIVQTNPITSAMQLL